MKIYLVRHGEIQGAGIKRFIGSTDVPLSDKGVEQGRRLRKYLSRISFDRVYSSDMRRTLTFAVIISGCSRNRIRRLQDLCEINLGDWEGKTFDEIQTHFPQEWRLRGEEITTYRPPSGESFSDLKARVIPCFESIPYEPDSNVLIVGHAGVNRVILSHIQGMELNCLFSIPQDYGALTIIKRKTKQEYSLHFPEYGSLICKSADH
ncbi:MAG: alpha-ribazole phosphatase [Desulfobacteraceae bacterium]